MNRMSDKPSHILAKITFVAVIAVIAALSSSAHSYDLEKKVEKYTLENGLKVLIMDRKLSPTVSLYIGRRTGAVDEASGKTGTAHFLEHMLFKGTKTIGTINYKEEEKILREIDRIGTALDREIMKGKDGDAKFKEELSLRLRELQDRAKKYVIPSEIDSLYTEHGAADFNASTGYDRTTYHVSLPANRIELWARIESDRMANPVFREFYSERNVIMEERRQTIESRPERMLMELFLATAYVTHPYRRPVIGWKSDMRFLDKTYMKKFYRENYAPNNTVITVVGDVNAQEVLEMIKRYFGKVPSQALPAAYIPSEPLQKGERRTVLESEANPRLIIGFHKPTLPSFDDYVFDVIDVILSGGRTSRLFKALVEGKEVAETVNTSNGVPGARYDNLFTIFASPRSPHSNGELERAIIDELQSLKDYPVSSRELQKAKNNLKADFLNSLDSNKGLARMLTYFELIAGDYTYITGHIKEIEKITPADIIKTAQKYFVRENKTVALLEKKGTH